MQTQTTVLLTPGQINIEWPGGRHKCTAYAVAQIGIHIGKGCRRITDINKGGYAQLFGEVMNVLHTGHRHGGCAVGGVAALNTDAVVLVAADRPGTPDAVSEVDRKSTRLNSSHVKISYAVFC